MKFTLSWLKDHLATEATLDDILYALTDLGLEVEDVDNPAEKLGAFRICRVIEAVPIPMPTGCGCAGWPPGRAGRARRCKRFRWSAARPMPAPGWSVSLPRSGPMCPAPALT